MSFYARWQPLVDEDRHTALVFGFFRHAPVSVGLEPWLGGVLGRPLRARPLQLQSFWPNLRSVIDGWEWTEPELVFDVEDESGPLRVVVEVKPGYEMHTLEQISRQAVDVASAPDTNRIAIVMIGADLGPPARTADWQEHLSGALSARGLDVQIETHYSSFAQIGESITAAGQARGEWGTYATDVVAQLKLKALLAYGGAPMLDDLQGLTLANAVEAFNRITKTARQFFLQLHADSAFRALGLQPVLGSGYTSPRMLRNGRADSITQADDAFTASVFLSIYMHPTLPDGHRIFIAFDLLAQDQSEVHLLAGRCERASTTDIAVRKLAAALRHEAAASGAPSELPYETTVGTSRWTYDRRLWQPGAAREDIKWTVTRAEAALLGLKA